MIGQVQTINGVKQAIPISGAIPTGLPVGTWISFEKDQAPDNKWIKAGETFNASDYPALYLFLGGNVVPERFDHDRLGNRQTINLNVSPENAPVMPFDGVVWVNCNPTTTNNSNLVLRIDEQTVERQSSNGGNQSSVFSPVKKGDKVRASTDNGTITSYVAYYNHPMFIKATSAIEITDQNTFLQTVQQCVAQGQSYSTEETLTGGTWIDGKPIYRKVVTFRNFSVPITIPNIKDIIDVKGYLIANTGNVLLFPWCSLNGNECVTLYKNTSGNLVWVSTGITLKSDVDSIAIIEYTKS